MVGRPRIHPQGTSTAERTALSRANRRASGRAAAQVVLSQRAVDALDAIAVATGEAGRAMAIERLATEAEERLP